METFLNASASFLIKLRPLDFHSRRPKLRLNLAPTATDRRLWSDARTKSGVGSASGSGLRCEYKPTSRRSCAIRRQMSARFRFVYEIRFCGQLRPLGGIRPIGGTLNNELLICSTELRRQQKTEIRGQGLSFFFFLDSKVD